MSKGDLEGVIFALGEKKTLHLLPQAHEHLSTSIKAPEHNGNQTQHLRLAQEHRLRVSLISTQPPWKSPKIMKMILKQ